MTVDVEDYFHVSAFADRIPSEQWPRFESRVVVNTHSLLRLLAEHDTLGTFFVLGWVAERFPELVRDIHRDGHEIGCHSYWHRLVYELTPEEFREDTIRSRDILGEITGEAPRLYRAPSFSITRASLWSLEVLAEAGFTGDSSIYPVYHDRYGIPDADPFTHQIVTPAGTIDEFPGTSLSFGPAALPISGGGYFRLYPVQFTDFCFRRAIAQSGQPVMFYIHPWEIDPGQPRLAGSLKSRFRHYQNLATTRKKLNWLLPRFSFAPMSQVIADSLSGQRDYQLSENIYRESAVDSATPVRQMQSPS
jgi:polysaccharide deacetylase family protein (PEP-CTERM system associated)